MNKESRYPEFLSGSSETHSQTQFLLHSQDPNPISNTNESPFTKATYDGQKYTRSEDIGPQIQMIVRQIDESIEESPIVSSIQKRIKSEEVAKMIIMLPLPEILDRDLTIADLNIPIFGGITPSKEVKTLDTLEILRKQFPGKEKSFYKPWFQIHMRPSKALDSTVLSPGSAEFNPGFHYGNKRNLVSKNLDETRRISFQTREELISNKKIQSKSILSMIKNIFCCHQERPNQRNSPKAQTLPKKPVEKQEVTVRGSQASLTNSSGPQKSLETLVENITQTSTANSNAQMKNCIKKEEMGKENLGKISKAELLESDLVGIPLETLFMLRKDVGICNLLAKIKFVDFFINDSCSNLAKKSVSNPCSNLHFFNLATFEREADFASFKKESLGRKISLNNFQTNPNARDSSSQQWTQNLKKKNSLVDQQILLNFHEKNMILDYDQWRNVTPEQCAKHTAKRIKNRGVILDSFCGIGGNLIYLAKENQVIGIDINQKSLLFAKHNAFNKGVLENVYLIQGDFTQMNLNRFNPDVIFLNPEVLDPASTKENFSIFNDVTPDLNFSLLKSYNACKNIVLCLPKQAKLQEIAGLISAVFKRTDRKIEDISIEIEYFFINGELEQIQVYMGEITQISHAEQVEFLLNVLCKGQAENNYSYKDIRTFLRFLLKKLKLPKLCFYLLKAEEIHDCEHSPFARFLNVLKMYQEIIEEDQEKFFRKVKIEDCTAESHNKKQKEKEEETVMSPIHLKSSFDETLMSPSYYSGNLNTLSDEKKKKMICGSENSLGGELWLDSINY